jgi:hypothetical protein
VSSPAAVGLLLLHGYGNVLARRLAPGDKVLVEPGGRPRDRRPPPRAGAVHRRRRAPFPRRDRTRLLRAVPRGRLVVHRVGQRAGVVSPARVPRGPVHRRAKGTAAPARRGQRVHPRPGRRRADLRGPARPGLHGPVRVHEHPPGAPGIAEGALAADSPGSPDRAPAGSRSSPSTGSGPGAPGAGTTSPPRGAGATGIRTRPFTGRSSATGSRRAQPRRGRRPREAFCGCSTVVSGPGKTRLMSPPSNRTRYGGSPPAPRTSTTSAIRSG